MKGTPGPSGSGWEVRRRGGGRAGGRWVAGVTRRACRYGSGQGPVHAVTPVARPVPSGPSRRLREGVRAPQPDSGPAPASPPGVGGGGGGLGGWRAGLASWRVGDGSGGGLPAGRAPNRGRRRPGRGGECLT
jgi:hypothetical protein